MTTCIDCGIEIQSRIAICTDCALAREAEGDSTDDLLAELEE